jgi:hypothetical protein
MSELVIATVGKALKLADSFGELMASKGHFARRGRARGCVAFAGVSISARIKRLLG